jgi:hypothetical protein
VFFRRNSQRFQYQIQQGGKNELAQPDEVFGWLSPSSILFTIPNGVYGSWEIIGFSVLLVTAIVPSHPPGWRIAGQGTWHFPR